jgi:SAM-dependent methyltransferase
MTTRHESSNRTLVEAEPSISPHNRPTAEVWDKNAEARARQIDSGKDLSRHFVIIPAMLEALGSRAYVAALDIGTGDGEFLDHLRRAQVSRRFVGIDVSEKMIDLARSRYANRSTRFLLLEAERAAEYFGPECFDLVTANMVLNTAPDHLGVIRGASRVLTRGGVFVLSVVHPRFFHLMEPLSRYVPAGFDASEEARIRFPLTIALDPAPLPCPILFFHRPVSTYLRALRDCGLMVLDFIEPLPPAGLKPEYMARWQLPRFLIIKAEKAPTR